LISEKTAKMHSSSSIQDAVSAAPELPVMEPLSLQRLLTLLGTTVDAAALKAACEAESAKTDAASPLDRLKRIVAALQRSDIAASLLQWSRFDLRRLPALVVWQGQWAVAQRDEQGVITVQVADHPPETLAPEQLAGSPVLWLRVKTPWLSTPLMEDVRSPASRLLLGEMFRSKKWLGEVIVATVIVNVLAVASSLFAMQVYDRVVPTFAWSTLWALSVGMVLIYGLDWMLKFSRSHIVDSLAAQVDEAVSLKLFERLMQLRLDTRPRSLGTLAAQLNGLESVRAFFSSSIVFTLADLPFALLFIGVIAIIAGPVSLVYLAVLPMALLLGWYAKERLAVLTKNELQRSYERHGMLVDTIQGAESIQASASAWRFSDNWASITSTISNFSIKNKHISSTTMTTVGTLNAMAYVMAIIVGVHVIESGELTMGGLIACSILGGRVIAPIAQAAQILVQWQHVREALNATNRLFSLEGQRREGQQLLAPSQLSGSLSLQGVRFSYPDVPVVRLQLHQLTFQPGDRVVVLGQVGCGKSTLLKVAAGLFKPTEGVVKLGDADLWELDPAQVGQELGYLPQDIHLFKGTLRWNLMLAGHASDDRLLDVVKLLGVDRIAADNSRGLEMDITEGGLGLSGGQRQLVGLARLFIAQPRVWLLDEPTASLDSDSEARVIEALRSSLRPDDILIVATHKPKLLSLCNRVIVMQKGAVVDDGPPDKVLAPSKHHKD
jgi:ATP-binding cassette, subfamily C, bacterial LapB